MIKLVALVFAVIIAVALSALSDDADMLKAAANGDTDKVTDFVRNKGVSLTTKNNNGVRFVVVESSTALRYHRTYFPIYFSAIIFAANNGHLGTVKQLVSLGANIEDRSNNWKTPLLWASLWGHAPVAEFLVSIGANISATDVFGLTTIMSATMSGNAGLVRFFIDKGANITAKNYYNGTAYTIAKSKQHDHIVDILRPYFPEEEDTRSPYEVLLSIIVEKMTFLLNLFVSEVTGIFGHQTNYTDEKEL